MIILAQRYNINYNGMWACFSGIIDAFITKFMNKDDYEEWRKIEYGPYYTDELAEGRNIETMDYAVVHIRLNRDREEAMECLLETGLPKDECEQLMDNMAREYYYPKLQEDGTYLCPNCGVVVQKGQKECTEEYCWNELIWKE